MVRAASMTVASTHPAALAVHSGSVTDKPRPECTGEMETKAYRVKNTSDRRRLYGKLKERESRRLR